MIFKTLVLVAATAFLSACGGSADTRASKIELRGDSITQHAKNILADYVPVTLKVQNLGLGGQKVSDMLGGTYGAMPSTLNPDTVYSFSFGANECIRNIPVQEYEHNIREVLRLTKGAKVILEAPWLITTDENGCNQKVETFRKVIVDVVKEHKALDGYYVTMPQLDTYQEPGGDIIHPGADHLRMRAKLMAAAIQLAGY